MSTYMGLSIPGGIWIGGVILVLLGLATLEDLQLSLIAKSTERRLVVARGSWEKKWDQLLMSFFLE